MRAHVPESQELRPEEGRWRIVAHRPGHEPVDITFVRGVPTTLRDWTWSDPFGPSTASLTFPSVTCWEPLGAGELFWLAPDVNVDIIWDGPLPEGYPFSEFRWEGYILPFDFTETDVSVNLIGALMQLDNYLAKPEYPTHPLAYEQAISRCWNLGTDLRIKPLQVNFPGWWKKRWLGPRGIPALNPVGLKPRSRWTGLLTRETGSWDKALTSYIQTMLASMYTKRGRWTLELLPGRRPVLMHRDFRHSPDSATVVVDPFQPGVKVSLSEDHSQSANVLYGQSKALTGEAYSGMDVSPDGSRTTYRPLAALRQAHPQTDSNGWLDRSRMRREMKIQAQEGLNADELFEVANNQLQVVSEPGVTGTITLTSDPRMYVAGDQPGPVLMRSLLRAGMSVQLESFRGLPEGIMLHVTEARMEHTSQTLTLTVDSKYRDKLTVDEVRLRGRDALAVPRMLIGGKIEPVLPDMLVPWNYAEGSGYIPSAPEFSARRLFDGMPAGVVFPYVEWTRLRPPRDPAWRGCYVTIGPKDVDEADKNWAKHPGRSGAFAVPIKMSQAGQARGLQLAAYNDDGELMPVGFHFSIYYQKDTNVASMPKIPAGKVPAGTQFKVGDHYPFFAGAWETYEEGGIQRGTEVPVSVQTAGLIQGWGTETVRAGYWPGRSDGGDRPTGLLVDEATWDWNTVGQTPDINPYVQQQVSPNAGYLYCMIYCDEQLDEPVHFMGRIFRVEPGSTA